MSSSPDHTLTPHITGSPDRVRSPLVRVVPAIALVLSVVAACGSGDESVGSTDSEQAATAVSSIRVVDPDDALELVENPPEALTIIDVRTPEEFEAGHLADAVLIDIYRDDFTQQLDALDRTAPYLIYCRSGNRSEQARQIMADLGFTDVTDIAGGYQAWQTAGHPVVQ